MQTTDAMVAFCDQIERIELSTRRRPRTLTASERKAVEAIRERCQSLDRQARIVPSPGPSRSMLWLGLTSFLLGIIILATT